jgi:hypothetical protein
MAHAFWNREELREFIHRAGCPERGRTSPFRGGSEKVRHRRNLAFRPRFSEGQEESHCPSQILGPSDRRGRRPRPSPPPRSGLRCCWNFGSNWLWFFAGCPTTATKAELLREPGSALRIVGCCHWMLTGEAPANTIRLDGQSMAGSEMPPEHLAAPAAFQANDIITMDGSPDRDGGCSLSVEFGCRFTNGYEGLMNSRD